MRKFVRRVAANEPTFLILVGLLLGVGTGYGAIACRAAIDFMRETVFGKPGDISVLAADLATPRWLVLILPAIGGLFVAPMVFIWAKEAKGHGVPEVMDAIARHAGRIRPRVALIKAAASVITIGTGGSVGWEGPIIQIGAGLGSTAGQLMRVARRHMRVLVSCGAAAGIAATFNAPIAGVLFALEVFVGDLAVVTFTPVVVAAVSAAAVSFLHHGPHGMLELPEDVFALHSVVEIPLYAVLGVACACGAVLFTRLLYAFEDAIDGARIPNLLKPALGGLAVGAIALGMPEAMGVGYHTIGQTVLGAFDLRMIVALFFVKLITTNLTLGSGGSGGIFGPSLVMGALLGSGFGSVLHDAIPSIVQHPGSYAVVGMAALVAGTTHAPISAILIIFEMTTDYALILPLMLACVISSTVARGILHESIYTLKLARRGIRLRGGRDVAVLSAITVGDTMRDDPTLLDKAMPFVRVRDAVLSSDHHLFPIVDGEGIAIGTIRLDDLRPFLFEEGLHDVAVAGDLMSDIGVVLRPHDDLSVARDSFVKAAIDELPVLDADGRVVGILREHDVNSAYNRAVAYLE